jgi:hypothetical protein
LNAKHFSELRKAANYTQSAVAAALGVGLRTVSAWESSDPPREFGRIETQAIRDLFFPILLGDRLRDQTDRAFAAIPSESVGIWIVERSECTLLPTASRIHDLVNNARLDMPSAECIAPMVDESLTTYPLRSGVPLNLAGEGITRHKAKKYKANRSSHIFHGGICESLLHVPAFRESANGPQPVLLLSLENKLDENNRVIISDPGVTQIYSGEDLEIAKALAEEFREDLRGHLELLGMIDEGIWV